MSLDCVHYLPLSVFVLLPSTFIICFIISITLEHVEVEFPYISDTGTHTPESCIFSQLLNIVSFLLVLTVYVRYKQIEQYYRDHLSPESSRILSINWIALWIGCVSAFGMSIVANFQETNVFRVHMAGAILCFGFGVMYAWMQTFMSFKMIPLVNSRRMAFFRACLSVLMTITFFSAATCGPLAFKKLKPGADPTKWGKHDGGWELHIVATICEWVSAMTLDTYILTFVREMHLISLSSPRVMFVIESLSLPAQESSWTGDMDQSIRPSLVTASSGPGTNNSSSRRHLMAVNDAILSGSGNDNSYHSVDSSAIIG